MQSLFLQAPPLLLKKTVKNIYEWVTRFFIIMNIVVTYDSVPHTL